MASLRTALFALATLATCSAQTDPIFEPGRNSIVHLFEWKYSDIAKECETFLAPKGYGGFQVSPVQENAILHVNGQRPWYERYQPVSYKLDTRSGTECEFRNMVERCNRVGVRTYADVLLNHMAGPTAAEGGTGGSLADPAKKDFPAVPYTEKNFHSSCPLNNWHDAKEVRVCELSQLKDLDQSQEYVREKMVEFLNYLIDTGIAGFRIDSAKQMWPEDLKAILDSVKNLSVAHGFEENTRPFIYQDVIDLAKEGVSYTEYTDMGIVTDFRHSNDIGRVFRGNDQLKHLANWGEEWNLVPGANSIVFVDNHDNQRGHGAGGANILNHKMFKQYKMATAFMLAHPHAQLTRIMSSFAFEKPEQGPPATADEKILSPTFNDDDTCNNGWVCEHRWRQIYNMVQFKNMVKGKPLSNWWDNGSNQIAFSRGNKGFVAFNNDKTDLTGSFQTGLPAGQYCDVISGNLKDGQCLGKTITVNDKGFADISIKTSEEDGVLALHLGSRVPTTCGAVATTAAAAATTTTAAA